MIGGFSFCGVDIDTLGIEYAPQLTDVYTFGLADTSVQEETYPAHTGGYYYGNTVLPKEFSLRCYFEGHHINHGLIDKILNFFYVGRTGKLVFKNRDWMWYVATITEAPQLDLTNYRNGTVTIEMKAYYPYARTDIFYANPNFDYKSLTEKTEDCSGVAGFAYDRSVSIQTQDGRSLVNAAFVDADKMPKIKFTASDFPSGTLVKNILLYNAGTAPADIAVVIAGEAGSDGVRIFNMNTNQEMKLVGFTKASTTSVSKYVVCDSISKKTVVTDGTTPVMNFAMHDYGFLSLAPANPSPEFQITYQAGSKIVACDGHFSENDVGRYIFQDPSWYKIVSVEDASHATLDQTIDANATRTGRICTLNNMIVYASSDTVIDKLEFIYKHTFR